MGAKKNTRSMRVTVSNAPELSDRSKQECMNLSTIPACQANSMAAEVYRGMQEFYAIPENMAKFLEWQKANSVTEVKYECSCPS